MRIAIALLSLGLTACVCPWSGQNCGLDGRMPPPRGGLDDTFPNVSPGEVDGAVEIPGSVALNVLNATDSTWAASAVHASLRSHSCVISVGPDRAAPRIHTLRQRRSAHLAPGVVTCDVP
jgi:hypothetical protein